MIPDMNINNNKQLNSIATEVLQYTKLMDMKTLRDKDEEHYRQAAANEFNKHLEIIEAVYMGATNGTIDTATNDDTSEESTTH